ncbi:putative bifunctional diguanylate cyclase/phosphodiesterase [Falsiroseomonas ponticola]|uniref:putative bifunctional diguanylate cyclase/phosphodiesterase n=1 Tax=Falsiroseomonas ponticola TaxID=2786951 RepID=UPI0019323C65|nr:bifunctional diguanylate cyclase/phosphodiesterase [Roseomonas ponticola]
MARPARPASIAPSPTPPVAALLALLALLVAALALLASNAMTERLLRADARARIESLGTDLLRRSPELGPMLRGGGVSDAGLATLEGIRAGGDVLQLRLLGTDGRVLVSDGAPDLAAATIATRVALRDAEGPAGTLEAVLDQAPRRALFRDAVRLAEGSIAMFGGAAFALLVWLALRRQRESTAEAQASFLRRHDATTGLATHAEFRERLDAALAMAREQEWQVGVQVIDLRRFREVNETHGHATGDLVLSLIASRLRGVMRRGDTVARLAGDRFAIVQSVLHEAGAAARLAERLAAAVAAPFALPGNLSITVAADIGLAIAPHDGADAETLLDRAEKALAIARAEPDAAIRSFEPALDAEARRQREIERDLRAAIADGALTLHYQPQFRLRDHALVGFEALLRWHHPERGMIPPGDFIPLAERSGLIIPLGAWVLRAACAEAARWPVPVRVAVNLSPTQFRQGGLVGTIADALATTGLPGHLLELEVTESLLQHDAEETERLLRAIRALGVSIAMDDFGTGWSSLAHLWRFPFGKLKIDRAFIRDLGHDPRLSAIVATIVALGRILGMTVVAEGVETEEQARLLAHEGCDQVQGWLYGRAMPAEDARALMAAQAEAAPRKVA